MIFLKSKKTLKKIENKINNFVIITVYFLINFYLLNNNIVFADGEEQTIKTASEIYQIAETNGIAHSICRAIAIGRILMFPMFGIMFVIIGFSFFQGTAKWSIFVTFAIGMAAMNSAPQLAEIFLPGAGLKYGCKCAIEKEIRDESGKITRYATNLNYDCSTGTKDYEEEYGKN